MDIDRAIALASFWMLSCIAGGIIGLARDRTRAGAALGLALGLLGVIIAFFLRPAEEVERERVGANPDRPRY